jgi:cell wall-associated NlpC family hydrolase
LNDTVTTYDARLTVTTSTMPAGAANSASLVGGFQSTSNHYRYRLTFNTTGSVSASINVVVSGTETTIAGATTIATAGTYAAGQVWHIRATHSAGAHALYAWQDGTTEPVSATLTATDTTYPSGKLGVRTLASSGATNAPQFQFDDYSASATWADPPVVTHPWRVRLLPAPFNGTVDTAWLTAALADTSPDLLDIATEYITGGSKEAGYGPLYAPGRSFDLGHADDGTRQEGSDWNDYLGITGNYPDLTTPATDTAEAHQLGCLDCSGFVRTVFGYRGGLPMCLDTSADFNGLRIPRRSVDQSASGPGTVVVSSVSAAPTDLSQVRPGDVLYWDADTSNPAEEEGQIDHSGIYLGIDSAGEMRFLSSRKVGNGPTMADLGGPSVITGTSLYGRALRRARRF